MGDIFDMARGAQLMRVSGLAADAMESVFEQLKDVQMTEETKQQAQLLLALASTGLVISLNTNAAKKGA